MAPTVASGTPYSLIDADGGIPKTTSATNQRPFGMSTAAPYAGFTIQTLFAIKASPVAQRVFIPAGSFPLVPGMAVAKVGRTTGATHGRITAIELDDVVVEYDLGNLAFDDQVEIESTGEGTFSAGGDSGSLILDEDNRGCALLFAGSETGGSNGRGVTYANPIGPVLKKLAITLHSN